MALLGLGGITVRVCLQLSAGQGPVECQRGVWHAARVVAREALARTVDIQLVDVVEGLEGQAWKSVVCVLEGDNAQALAQSWAGTILWIHGARSGASRKNWYLSGTTWADVPAIDPKGVVFDTCRSSGAGGQHVNTTNSAVRATHVATGLAVKIQSERSQHANKATALAVLTMKIHALNMNRAAQQGQQQRQAHHELVRGNPLRTFLGADFTPKR